MDEIKIGVSLVNYHNTTEVVSMAEKYLGVPMVSMITIVNNDCNNTDLSILEKLDSEKIKVFREQDNLGYSKGNNIGLRYLVEKEKCDYVIISNSDIDFENDMIEALVKKLDCSNEFGAMAPQMLQSDGSILPLRYIDMGIRRLILRVFVTNLDKKYENNIQMKNDVFEQSFLPGSFFIVKSKVMKDCGYFDPNIFLYREEEILGFRIKKAGYKLGVVKKLFYIHNHNYSEQSLKQIYEMQIRSMKSERYLFKKYCNYGNIKMAIVYLFQALFVCRELLKPAIRRMLKK